MTASQTDPMPRLQILWLALLAASTLAVIRVGTAWQPGLQFLQVALEFAAAIGLLLLVRSQTTVREQGWKSLGVCLVCGLCYPMAIDTVQRWFGNSGNANELNMLICFQWLAIIFAIFSYLPRLTGLSVVASSFLVLFTTTMTTDPIGYVLAGCFGVLGLWWMMGAYWDRIEGAFAASSVQRQTPVRALFIAVTGCLLCLLAVLFATSDSAAVVLRGFMPTSGGNNWHDPNARSGVGDGDAMVAAKDEALSFGPVESELFLDSERPTLYDMFDDTYGEPTLKKRKQQQAVGIEAQEREDDANRNMSRTERSGREFSTVRRRANRKRKSLDDRKAPAMFYVVGSTPLHLGLESYDAFDGREWSQQEKWEPHRRPWLDERFGKPWINFRSRFAEHTFFQGERNHAVKVINLKTNRIPSPPHLTEVHIDMVDRLGFFGWTKDGMVEMSNRDFMPQLTVLHLHSRSQYLEPLRGAGDFTRQLPRNSASSLKPYLHESVDHSDVANSWTKGVDRGWRQVEAIVARLRNDFEHNPEARAPEDCEDVVAHFLKSGEGPDYMFATTAASMLRSLGYPTRLVSGFYAKPERYSHRAGQTSVLSEDVHVWAEVCVDGQSWLTIEPTPGFEPPTEYLTWRQTLVSAVKRCVEWIRHNLIAFSLTVAALIALLIWRRFWLDLAGSTFCNLLGSRSAEARLAWTLRLLEWRAFLAGRSRPQAQTITGWYSPLAEKATEEIRTSVHNFFRWSDRLLYSPDGISTVEGDEIRRACAAMIAASNRKVLQTLPAPTK